MNEGVASNGVKPPKRSAAKGAACGNETMYLAKAKARGNAPLPSLPRNKRAWL
jgi:hypothetical protein